MLLTRRGVAREARRGDHPRLQRRHHCLQLAPVLPEHHVLRAEVDTLHRIDVAALIEVLGGCALGRVVQQVVVFAGGLGRVPQPELMAELASVLRERDARRAAEARAGGSP